MVDEPRRPCVYSCRWPDFVSQPSSRPVSFWFLWPAGLALQTPEPWIESICFIPYVSCAATSALSFPDAGIGKAVLPRGVEVRIKH